jgi:predicted rRNA methylase YqxC with S4 and FtsJ domains
MNKFDYCLHESELLVVILMGNFDWTREKAKNLILCEKVKIDGKTVSDLFFRVKSSCFVEIVGLFDFRIEKP